MRSLKKNQRKLYYSLYDDEIPILNDKGELELETMAGYTNPVIFHANLSAGKSNAEESPFGKDVSYDRVISTCDMDLPIDENSIIWVKNKPTYNAEGTVNGDSADYEVAAPPLDGLNSLLIAIKKRSKSVVDNSSNSEENGTDSGNNEDNSGSSDVVEDDGF